MRKVVATPEFAASVQKFGIRISNLGSRELAAVMEEETQRWSRMLSYAGIQPE